MGHEQRPIARPRDFLDDDQERTLRVLVLDETAEKSRDSSTPSHPSRSKPI
jgi:hypothetical protein